MLADGEKQYRDDVVFGEQYRTLSRASASQSTLQAVILRREFPLSGNIPLELS